MKRHAEEASSPPTPHFASRFAKPSQQPSSAMLKLRAVLSLAVVALLAITSLDGVAAQVVTTAPPASDPTTKTPTTETPTTAPPSTAPTTQRWSHCKASSTCEKGTYCKTFINKLALCYPV
jgi:hypothetical protein